MKYMTNTICFDLAPINPNVNNIYYDIISYKKAIYKYIESGDKGIYTSYNDNKKELGTIIDYNYDKHKITAIIQPDCVNFINSNEYYVGFKFNVSLLNKEKRLYYINRIEYAVIISKYDLDTTMFINHNIIDKEI